MALLHASQFCANPECNLNFLKPLLISWVNVLHVTFFIRFVRFILPNYLSFLVALKCFHFIFKISLLHYKTWDLPFVDVYQGGKLVFENKICTLWRSFVFSGLSCTLTIKTSYSIWLFAIWSEFSADSNQFVCTYLNFFITVTIFMSPMQMCKSLMHLAFFLLWIFFRRTILQDGKCLIFLPIKLIKF